VEQNNEQDIYFLLEHSWCVGKLVRTNKKTYTIFYNAPAGIPHNRTVPKEKCAFPGESVCVVWETWRGVNGRGGYRVERELYPESRVPAERVDNRMFASSGRVNEKSHGVHGIKTI
jgi:hypothetical protein